MALGYTLVYGIIELINFAHGDVFMWGTMIAVTVSSGWLGLNGTQAWYGPRRSSCVTLLAAMFFCAALNVSDRTGRLPAAAKRAQAGAADHGDRHVASCSRTSGGHLGVQRAAADTDGCDIFPTNTLFTIGGVPYRPSR